ncbi:hypothetical protein SLS58_007962 [Diplodia intermedia]|uniref:Ankyrin n=1 Tax=Diplodia intermedia TaxID=856260 RepID=A0ABR3TIK3_9PEZI
MDVTDDGISDTEAREIRGWTLLMYVVVGAYDEDGCEEGQDGKRRKNNILEPILQTGRFDINTRDNRGWSPLALAVEYENLKTTGILLAHANTNPNIRDYCGRTPLIQAARTGNTAIVQRLLIHDKTEPSLLDNNGKSALYFAVRSGNAEVVRLLLRTGRVKANSKPDLFGMTPLLWATIHSDVTMVDLLLETGEFDSEDLRDADAEATMRLERSRERRLGRGRGMNSSQRYDDFGRHWGLSLTFGNADRAFSSYIDVKGMKSKSFISLLSYSLRRGTITLAFSLPICPSSLHAICAEMSTPSVQLASMYPKAKVKFGRPSTISPFHT